MKHIINEIISENVKKCQKPQNNVLKRIIVSMSLCVECGWGLGAWRAGAWGAGAGGEGHGGIQKKMSEILKKYPKNSNNVKKCKKM